MVKIMRNFYILGVDPYPDEAPIVISKYEMGDFPLYLLWDAVVIEEIPNFVRLYAKNCKSPTDYVGNPISWIICSPDFLNIIRSVAAHDMQVFDAPIVCEGTGEFIEGYKIINPIKRIECMDLEHPAHSVTKMILVEAKIPIEVNLFRVHERPNAVIVSDQVARALKESSAKGYILHPLKVI